MPTNRLSQTQPPPVEPAAYFTYCECAAILGCHWTACQQAEDRALRKLRSDLVLQRLWQDLVAMRQEA